MNGNPVSRRLAAILAADVAGYSRLMNENEDAAIALWRRCRVEAIDPILSEFNGRIVKNTGDGFLAEFATVIEAVKGAIALQRRLADVNGAENDTRKMRFRMGVNLGEIVVDGDDIHGDGVNIATELEGMAEPDGLCLSAAVMDQVLGKIDCEAEDLGDRALDSGDAVHVYLVSPILAFPTGQIAGFGDRPAVAVLPFINMSNDPEQEYFADGITEDVITNLSRWRDVPVISRNSVFTYKGLAADLKKVGRELGAQYILEGSVRKSGKRVRITVQLIEAATDFHVWAEKYDRLLEDIFDLQDEITERIVTAITPEITRAEQQKSASKDPDVMTAWDLVLQAQFELAKVAAGSHKKARALLEQAIGTDVRSQRAQMLLAQTHMEEVIWGWSDNPPVSVEVALDHAETAVSIDDSDCWSQCLLAMCLMIARQHDRADKTMRRAKELNPFFGLCYLGHAMIHLMAGNQEEVEPNIDLALRLSPRDPLKTFMLSHVSLSNLLRHNFDTAIEWARKAIAEFPQNPMAHQYLASALGHKGELKDAASALTEAKRLRPEFSPRYVRQAYPFKKPEDAEFLIDGAVRAGLTDD